MLVRQCEPEEAQVRALQRGALDKEIFGSPAGPLAEKRCEPSGAARSSATFRFAEGDFPIESWDTGAMAFERTLGPVGVLREQASVRR